MSEPLTDAQMIEELKTWDDEAWRKFKQTQYEVISLNFESLDDE
jgi:hypothetical protein